MISFEHKPEPEPNVPLQAAATPLKLEAPVWPKKERRVRQIPWPKSEDWREQHDPNAQH